MRRLPWFVLPLLLGCGIVSGPSPADPTRAALDSRHVTYTTIAVVGGVLTATCGAAVPIVDEFADPDDVSTGNLVLGLCSVVGGGLTLFGTTMASDAVQDWAALDGGGTP